MEGDPLFVSVAITCLGRRKMLCPSCSCQNSSIALPLQMSSKRRPETRPAARSPCTGPEARLEIRAEMQPAARRHTWPEARLEDSKKFPRPINEDAFRECLRDLPDTFAVARHEHLGE